MGEGRDGEGGMWQEGGEKGGRGWVEKEEKGVREGCGSGGETGRMDSLLFLTSTSNYTEIGTNERNTGQMHKYNAYRYVSTPPPHPFFIFFILFYILYFFKYFPPVLTKRIGLLSKV